MRIYNPPTLTTANLLVNSDIDMLTVWQVKGLAAPASGEALRKGNKDIANAEVADAAAILRSKLNFGAGLVNADIAAAAAIALSKLAALPAALTVAETEVYDAAAPVSWTDLDLNAVVGANSALVFLKVTIKTGTVNDNVAFRKNGDTDEFLSGGAVPLGIACANVAGESVVFAVFAVFTDASGVVEWIMENNRAVTVDVIGYIV